MAEFMDQDEVDGTKALSNVQGLKFEFDRHDIKCGYAVSRSGLSSLRSKASG